MLHLLTCFNLTSLREFPKKRQEWAWERERCVLDCPSGTGYYWGRLQRTGVEDAMMAAAARGISIIGDVLQESTTGVAFLDATLHYLAVNDALARMNGLPVHDHTGKRIRDVVPHLWPQIRAILEESRGDAIERRTIRDTHFPESSIKEWLLSFYPPPLAHPMPLLAVVSEATDHARIRSILHDIFLAPDPPEPKEPLHPELEPASDWRIEHMISHIGAECGATHLSLAAFSAQFQTSERHLGRLFHRHVGMSFRTYLRWVRMNHAASMLTAASLDVHDVATTLGYDNPGNFTRDFRAVFGCTPTAYSRPLTVV